MYTLCVVRFHINIIQQLGTHGSQFVMASIPGRPHNVGFTFRVIATPYGHHHVLVTVTEYTYNTNTAALENTTPLKTAETLTQGSYLEFTVGRDKDTFTVVYISCRSLCEVRIIVTIYQFIAIFDLA